jgi:RNA polymerase sigma-70 factor (ECF subfamily)
MHFRKSKKQYEVPVDENRIKDLAEEIEMSGQMSIEDQEKLVRLVNELDQDQQDLIELRFFQQFSFKEIADIYNITEANAKMRTYRILERIAKKWKETK